MKILALDPSLTCTGWALSGGGMGTIKSKDTGMRRIAMILEQVDALSEDTDLVVIEGYSFASRGRAIISLGELGGVLRYHLWKTMRAYVEVAPTTRAKYATGKGNASKEAVLVEAVKRLGYTGSSHDEADALWLLHMALDHYNLPDYANMPQVNRQALTAVPWPKP